MRRDHRISYSVTRQGEYVCFKLYRNNGIGQPTQEVEVLLQPNEVAGILWALTEAQTMSEEQS